MAERPVDRGREIFRRTLDRDPTGFVARNGWATGIWSKCSPRWDTRGPKTITRSAIWRAAAELVAGHHLGHPQRVAQAKGLWGCPLLLRLTQSMPQLRIAMHPFDFDHPDVIASIARIVAQAMQVREQAFYPELLAADDMARAA